MPAIPEPLIFSQEDVTEMVGLVLAKADEPATVTSILSALPKATRPNSEQLAAVLGVLVDCGAVALFPDDRKGQPRYWDRSREELVRQLIRRKLHAEAMTKSKASTAVIDRAAYRGLPKSLFESQWKELTASGELRELPPFVGARTKRYSMAPLEPADYVEDALEKIAKKLAPCGISREDLARSLAQWRPPANNAGATATNDHITSPEGSDRRALMLERIQAAYPEASQGALVLVKDLRESLDFQQLSKHEFDQLLLELSHEGRLSLYEHGRPHLISDEERELLVTDGHNRYFNAVALRRPS